MNIAIIGYGTMGKAIERLAATEHCTVVSIYHDEHRLTEAIDAPWDVAIDFSVPSAVLHNAEIVAKSGKGLVIGTTGWYASMPQLQELANRYSLGCVVGSNFSVGVQMFFRLARAAGLLVNNTPEYDVAIHETHHVRKTDSPSGTALTLSTIILDEVTRKEYIQTETQHGRIDPQALHVTSTRVGDVAGRHVITIDGPDDRIELIHNAQNREGFARGALRAARWIAGKQGLFNFTEVFTQVSP